MIMNIKDCIEKATGELPSGAMVNIAVENGSAYIEASNIDDECFDMDQGDMTLEEHFMAAVQWCKETTQPINNT